MSKICAITGRKANKQKAGIHASGKSRGGKKAFSYTGPHKYKAVKHTKTQDVNFVTVRTPLGKMLVSMKAYKTYFKTQWMPAESV